MGFVRKIPNYREFSESRNIILQIFVLRKNCNYSTIGRTACCILYKRCCKVVRIRANLGKRSYR